jgi:hypothetical protein
LRQFFKSSTAKFGSYPVDSTAFQGHRR